MFLFEIIQLLELELKLVRLQIFQLEIEQCSMVQIQKQALSNVLIKNYFIFNSKRLKKISSLLPISVGTNLKKLHLKWKFSILIHF